MASTHLNQQQNTNITEMSPSIDEEGSRQGTPQSSNNNTPNISNSNSNNFDLLDPNIIADREASMQVTTWVRSNYVQEREHNVPRRNMFEHYKSYCTTSHIPPVNSATFGKLLRVVFPELKTRRLGVRGQSKYHYCGIRVRAPDEFDHSSTLAMPLQNNMLTQENNISIDIAGLNTSKKRYSNSSENTSTANSPAPTSSTNKTQGLHGFTVPTITSFRFNSETDNNLIVSFTHMYEAHCREVFKLLSSYQHEQVRDAMLHFYNDMDNEYIGIIQNIPEITEAVWRWDCILYDSIIGTFVPSVNFSLPQDMVKALRTYTRELSDYIESCMMHFPTSFHQKKADVARIFSAKCRRQLYLCSIAQSASAVLNMPEHLTSMRHDWESFNFEGILDQTLWVCECDTAEIREILYQEVTELLTTKISLEHWMAWISTLVDKYLKSFAPNSMNDAPHYLARSKQLLLKWNFYTSLIMKDLALHQCSSFGSFHSLKVFLDDYILFIVEENIAQVNYSLMQQHHQQQQQQASNVNYYSPVTTTGSPSGISK